ncbi:mitochondrial import receptor subunit TOM22 [Aspergillus brunneoviolaceus CBS 621.78]|uniref:Tom22-domain-containing protein n=1 Tax=Aspergillus brunneoviolaceus CBS 621.78 TaxID=1450534 RepID=A0ACD1GGI4_9EURO|nr:Tom22-domain-containing protein [Aspergillus brunneoviolaceus CBS 621.78]RAH48280.1 Tom22-domain-containing protein [Aspergillus brunneoviolaceus CBS 621.78]
MVKLTEVEDEHFAQEKPQPSKHNVLLASDDEEEDDDYTDTESEISTESYEELESETLYDRIYALKDMLPPSARRSLTSTVNTVTSFTKSSVTFSGKALWIISTSAFLLGVPWALAYAEEEQYIQMEREQGMIKGANEVWFYCFFFLSGHLFCYCFFRLLGNSGLEGFEQRRAKSPLPLFPCSRPKPRESLATKSLVYTIQAETAIASTDTRKTPRKRC